jgi:hypothetical protein
MAGALARSRKWLMLIILTRMVKQIPKGVFAM